MCSAAMLCCSCTTDPSSWYSTCHFLGAGEHSSNTGDLYERETTRRTIITSPLSMHTHTQIYTWLLRTCKSCALCTHSSFDSWTVCMSKHIGARSFLIWSANLKHVAQPITATRCDLQLLQQTNTCVCNRAAKIFPMQFVLKQTSSHGNFPFAPQLLEIQSSSGLTSWLALLPNKAPIVWNL